MNNCVILCYLKDDKTEKILKLNLVQKTKMTIIDSLMLTYNNLPNDEIDFDGNFKPDDDQIFRVQNFSIPPLIVRALEDYQAVEDFDLKIHKVELIKYIFFGTLMDANPLIIFQLFQKSQVLKKGVRLVLNTNTLKELDKTIITITENVDAIYNGNLLFTSFQRARRIFDLTEYYRQATDDELNEFCKSDCLHFTNSKEFVQTCNQWSRRKIAQIADSGILKEKSVNEIFGVAKILDINLNLIVVNGETKIQIPTDKDDQKQVLNFLNEDMFSGPISKKRFETNSKRKV